VIPVADFAAFFLSGYLLWQFFQNSCQGAIHSVVGNGDLVKKVYFPREVLPLSHVLAQLVHLLLALLVVSPYLVYTRGWSVLAHLPLTLGPSACWPCSPPGSRCGSPGSTSPSVTSRSCSSSSSWCGSTPPPVLYPLALVRSGWAGDAAHWLATALQFNPMTWFVELFRAPLYGKVTENDRVRHRDRSARRGARALLDPRRAVGDGRGGVGRLGPVALVAGYVVFSRRARTFAKEV
jgi:hypothetical protein